MFFHFIMVNSDFSLVFLFPDLSINKFFYWYKSTKVHKANKLNTICSVNLLTSWLRNRIWGLIDVFNQAGIIWNNPVNTTNSLFQTENGDFYSTTIFFFSRSSNHFFLHIPPPYPVRFPFSPITRWHGISIEILFIPLALATARMAVCRLIETACCL